MKATTGQPSVLFVCTGNICRSPMAEALFQRLVPKDRERSTWHIQSVGTRALPGMPASPNAQTVMKTRGLDIQEHRSHPVNRDLLERFNLILTMEADHKEALQVEFPELADRIYMLSEMVGEKKDIEDPIGSHLEAYDATDREIDRYLTVGFKKIQKLAVS